MYSLIQCRYIAREIIRAGGFPSKAARSLRNNYEGFEKICPGTIRAMLDKKFFRDLRKKQAKIMAQAQAATELEAEKARLRAAALDKNPVKATASEVIKDLRTHPAHKYDMQALHIVLDYLDLVKRL